VRIIKCRTWDRICYCTYNLVGSVAERVKRRFYGGRVVTTGSDLGSTPTLVAHVVASLNRALYDDYLCLVAFKQAANLVVRSQTTEKLENGQLLSGCGFVQNIAPPALSRDRRRKMKQTKTLVAGEAHSTFENKYQVLLC